MKKNISFRCPERRARGLLRLAATGACLLAAFSPKCRAADSTNAAAILLDLRSFREFATVLYIAAHPDDEDTQLITFLARGRGYRAAYLSVTRGDGGQNGLGPEFDEQLGVIRTQELLAARRLDGGRQFFTRAIDFGYSKNYQETLGIWDKQQAVSDVVRVIRTFQPDVVIAGFAPQQTPGNHGHHIASAFLAVDAFKLAGDPKAFPEQLGELKPWQPKRLLQNIGFFGRGGGGGNPPAGPHLEISGNDPVLGISFNELATRSRAMHRTQFGIPGGFGGGGGSRNASFLVLDGQPATNDIMDGIDTTWNRVPGGAEIGKLATDAIAKFNPTNPAASVPVLLAIHGKLAALPRGNRIVDEKRTQLDRIIQSCLDLSVETTVPQAEVVPGEELKLHHTVAVRSDIPVRWVAVRYPSIKRELNKPIDLRVNEVTTRDSDQTLPAATPLSQPYWLREERTTGMYQVADPSLIGTPENPPVFPVEQVFEVGGQTLVIHDQPIQWMPDRPEPQQRRPLAVVPPVALKFASEVRHFTPGEAKPVEVDVTTLRPGINGTLQLNAPPDGTSRRPASRSN